MPAKDARKAALSVSTPGIVLPKPGGRASKCPRGAEGGVVSRGLAAPAQFNEKLSTVLPKPPIDGKGRIFCPILKDWRMAKPEEVVRQSYILHLNRHYGYQFEQMAQERKTQHGRRSPKADIVVYETAEKCRQRKSPVIVVECKAESVDIHPKDYYQGESYARATGCELLVMHNERQTFFAKLVPGTPGEQVPINELPRAEDWGDAKKIEAIKNRTRAFSRKEFQDLLFRCHCILRDVHKMEPGTAFDAMSKVLFIKMYIERTGTWGTFTTEYLDKRAAVRLPTDPPVHEQLFDQTKRHYRADEIFADREQLDISEETFRRIVRELERFNLSATGDDVKGLAFERFLGDTFRGNLGQFFTPRPVVDFMVDLLDPQEGDFICDPAAGSGGFLIRTFEHIRRGIEEDVQQAKDKARAEIEALNLPEESEAAKIAEAFAACNRELDPEQANPISRLRKLAHEHIFGTDAEPRAARTAKMNMIMHGDGHGGIHFHDGLLDINGIFQGRFNLVLTNPPFGSSVGDDQKVGGSEQTRVSNDPEYLKRCAKYGPEWEASHARMLNAAKDAEPILNLYEIGKDKPNRDTELVFLERCLQLLRAGGRMGIVMPDGNLNNPSLGWLRRWAEGKAKLLAVVSLPEETFRWAEATVKASIVFLKKFTPEEEAAWDEAWKAAEAHHRAPFDKRRTELCAEYGPRIACGDDAGLAKLLKELAGLGVRRDLPEWRLKPPPPYPRGVVQTDVGWPRWEGGAEKGEEKKCARKLKDEFEGLWTEALSEQASELHRELRTALRKLDREHQRALWQHVREALDYPVFTAAPEFVGITSTGADGPNQLPAVLQAYRQFEEWLRGGAKEAATPKFEL